MASSAKISLLPKTSTMNIFITGATGYIGNQLALKLANSNVIVHALVRNPSKAKCLDHSNIRLFKGDINDIDSVRRAMQGCEQVYHLAAFARLWAKPSDIFYKTNVDGTKNILDAAVEHRVSRLVYTSSTAVFGQSFKEPLCEDDPRTTGFNNDYDLSKCMAEKLVFDYANKGLNALIVNPSRVYGPGYESFSNPFTKFLKALLKWRPIVVPRCPNVVGNYGYLDDVVEGHMLAMKYGKAGERYILGGENVSYRELLRIVRTEIPGRVVVAVPKVLLKIAGTIQVILFYFTKTQPAFNSSAIDRYYVNAAFSCQKAIAELNYKITPFKQGMTDTIYHLKQKLNEQK
ncbi:MAG: hypothetical protein C5B54_02500 [Acidobacteria bacterium]|nr:MAG: hypothetical protein C5B54_02500 [Acidobacteriota bacterium]